LYCLAHLFWHQSLWRDTQMCDSLPVYPSFAIKKRSWLNYFDHCVQYSMLAVEIFYMAHFKNFLVNNALRFFYMTRHRLPINLCVLVTEFIFKQNATFNTLMTFHLSFWWRRYVNMFKQHIKYISIGLKLDSYFQLDAINVGTICCVSDLFL